MLRPVRILIAILSLAGGAALGALNPGIVTVDLGIRRFDAPLGVVLLGALLVGLLVGGLALTASVVLPMRHRLLKERKAAASMKAAQPRTQSPTPPGDADDGLHQ